jgi:deazaflavin-dependent oxidoreductase (nitroreductase family)
MWYNTFMIWLLKSPLHFLISKNILLISFAGRKSGKSYHLPVNYLRQGDILYLTSWRERRWWRNLRAGQPVTVRVQGQNLAALPSVIENDEGVAALLTTYFQIAPSLARYFRVGLDPQRKPLPADVRVAAQTRVMITLKIQQ